MLDYVYDKIGRIKEANNSQTGNSEKFSFDPAHNILSDGLKDKGRLKGTNIGEGNRLESFNGTEYTYDALGNLIYRQLPDGENQYFVYDTENQPIRAEIKKPKGNTEIWEYAYDPFGRRLSKDKLAWTSTAPKRTHFVWDGTRLLQEYSYKGSYTYIYTDQDSYEPLAQIFDNAKDGKQYLSYFHTDQIGIPREMTDQFGNLLWYGEYTAWGRLKTDERVYQHVHQPFRLQNQYCDEETGLHYNYFRYYEPDAGRFVNQDPIGLWGGDNLYFFAPNANVWVDPLGLLFFDPNHGDLFPTTGDQKNTVQITMQGSRGRDFTAAFKAAGIPRADATGYTWHHVDDFDPQTGKTTMQLVRTDGDHKSTGHKGSVHQFEKRYGVTYGTPKAVGLSQRKGWLTGRRPSKKRRKKKKTGAC